MRTKPDGTTSGTGEQPSSLSAWTDREAEGCCFKDVRLAKRFGKLLGMLSEGIGESIPYVCQDWANTKAAYRFFSNSELSEDQIRGGHLRATRDRLCEAKRKILMRHDTCEFSFQRDKDSKFGLLGRPSCGKGKDGRLKQFTVRGILMHSSLTLTLDGLPLGLAAIKFWTRKQFKGCNVLKKKINPTRVPIEETESIRWLENLRQSTVLANNPGDCVHVGDRESDIYELFSLVIELKTKLHQLMGLGSGLILVIQGCSHHASQAVWETPVTLTSLLATTTNELAGVDIALVNLLCAQGVPGSETVDVTISLTVLDQWAARVRSETDRHHYRFERNPAEFEHSKGFFNMLILGVVLAEDFKIHYRTDRQVAPDTASINDGFFADARDVMVSFAGRKVP